MKFENSQLIPKKWKDDVDQFDFTMEANNKQSTLTRSSSKNLNSGLNNNNNNNTGMSQVTVSGKNSEAKNQQLL